MEEYDDDDDDDDYHIYKKRFNDLHDKYDEKWDDDEKARHLEDMMDANEG